MAVISFYNHVGGSGRSVLTRDVSYAFGQYGYRVLVIDLDAQANLTTFFGIDPDQISENETAWSAFAITPKTFFNQRVEPISIHGINLIPAIPRLAALDAHLHVTKAKKHLLRAALKKIKNQYDFVFIDSPLNLGPLTFNALTASDYVVAPVNMTKKSHAGTHRFFKLLNQSFPSVKPLAIAPTRLSRTSGTRKNTRATFNQAIPVLSPTTWQGAVYGEAEESGSPVLAYAPNTTAASEITTVAKELLALLGQECSMGRGRESAENARRTSAVRTDYGHRAIPPQKDHSDDFDSEAFGQYRVYLHPSTYRDVTEALLKHTSTPNDFSTLIENLLTNWLKTRKLQQL